MLMAFSRTSLLFLTGQTSTQTPHPVQSSGATWMVYFIPAHSLSRASQALNVEGAPGQFLAVVHLDADDGMRANHSALAALDADLRIPRRNFQSQIALLPFRGARREGSVAGEGADGEFVAATGVDCAQHVVLELRSSRERGRNFGLAAYCLRNLDLEQVRQRGIHGLHVLLDHVFALAPVSVANGLADRFDGFVARQNFGDREEADLHDGVRARAHAGILCDLVRIDRVQFRFLGDELRLNLTGQVIPHFIFSKGTVDQENCRPVPTNSACRSAREISIDGRR